MSHWGGGGSLPQPVLGTPQGHQDTSDGCWAQLVMVTQVIGTGPHGQPGALVPMGPTPQCLPQPQAGPPLPAFQFPGTSPVHPSLCQYPGPAARYRPLLPGIGSPCSPVPGASPTGFTPVPARRSQYPPFPVSPAPRYRPPPPRARPRPSGRDGATWRPRRGTHAWGETGTRVGTPAGGRRHTPLGTHGGTEGVVGGGSCEDGDRWGGAVGTAGTTTGQLAQPWHSRHRRGTADITMSHLAPTWDTQYSHGTPGITMAQLAPPWDTQNSHGTLGTTIGHLAQPAPLWHT